MEEITSEWQAFKQEEVIFSRVTGLYLDADFFAQNQDVNKSVLTPLISAMLNDCDEVITKAGTYTAQLKISRLK